MVAIVQDWAPGKSIQCVFHILYYHQANRIVEQTNGLIKKHADVSRLSWGVHLSQVVFIVNNCCGSYGNPKTREFSPERPLMGYHPTLGSGRNQLAEDACGQTCHSETLALVQCR